MATQAEVKWALKRPRIFPGYTYWLVGMLNAFVGYGVYMYAWGVYVPYFIKEFKFKNSEIGIVNTVQRIDSGIEAPIAGYFLDTAGPKWVSSVCLFFGGIGYVLVWWWPVPQVWWLWFSKGFVIAIMGQAGLYFTSNKVMTWYFIKHRGRMMGLLTIGAAFGGMVFVGMTELVAQSVWGWRGAAFISALCFFTLVPVNWFLYPTKAPQHYGLLPDNEKLPHERTKEELEAAKSKGAIKVMTADDFLPDMGVRDAFKTRAFWCLAISGAFGGFTTFGTQTWFAAHLQAEGYTSGQAAFFYAMFFPATLLGRLAVAAWADRINPKWFQVWAYWGQALPTIPLALLIAGKNDLWVWVWVVLNGAAFGSSPAVGGHLRASWFGRKWYATLAGMTQLIDIGFGAGGPFFVGWLADVFGNYRMSFLYIAAMWLLQGSAYVILGHAPKQMQEAKRKAREFGIRVV
ncbi:MAG: MFS transporter [Chloroflexi bacterium]|nr:MFS transporter [Chloroflexota bacterium]